MSAVEELLRLLSDVKLISLAHSGTAARACIDQLGEAGEQTSREHVLQGGTAMSGSQDTFGHKSCQGKGHQGHQVARDAIRFLSSRQQYTVGPQRMGLLVTGLHLVCCWRYLAALVEGFESRGLHCLWEIWATAMVALVLGQIAKYFTPAEPQPLADEELDVVVPELVGSSSLRPPATIKEGQELGYPSEPISVKAAGATAVGLAAEDDQEDMATVKRRAQEEAAAKLAMYRAEVQQLLSSIRQQAASSSGTINGQLLFRLADQLFASPINLSEFVGLGGVPVVVAAVAALCRPLAAGAAAAAGAARQQQQHQEIEEVVEEEEEQNQQQQQQEAVLTAGLPALLQASWVLLQVSQGPPACKAALQDPAATSALLAAARAVTALPPAAARGSEPILRNMWWTLLTLCDRPPARGGSSSSTQQGSNATQAQRNNSSSSMGSFQQQLLRQYQDAGAVQMLQRLLSLQHGPSAGWVAAAQLGLLIQLGHEAQQQQQQQAAATLQEQLPSQQQQHDDTQAGDLSALSAAAACAVLQEDSVSGLCYLVMSLQLEQQQATQQQAQLSGRLRVLMEGMLHYLVTFHSPQLLQLLIEQQLLGCFATHCPTRLGRLLVCQLLSSKGQQVMAAVEEGFELDVPLALAQIIPLKLHIKLPTPPARQQQQQHHGEIEPLDDGQQGEQQEQQVAQSSQQEHEQQAAAAAMADDMYTDILACRLLLQHNRLWELLAAFCEELQAPPEQQQEEGAPPMLEQEGGVVPASLVLVQHLMSRDLQLQAAQHVRGDSISDSLSGTSSSNSSRSLQEALAMPDHTGTYSRVLAGMVPAEQLPAAAAAAAAQNTSTSGGSSSQADELSLPGEAAAVTPAAPAGAGRPPVVFKFGQLEHAVGAATFKEMKRSSKLIQSILGRVQVHGQEPVTVLAIPQFTDEANVWVLQCLERWLSSRALAGFSVLQAAKLWIAADFLQVNALQVACEDLMAEQFRQDPQHLQIALELCARHTESGARLVRLLVQHLLKRVSTGQAGAAGQQQQEQEEVQLLRQLLEQHAGVLLPVIHDELRDRLVTLCTLNAGLDAEDPADVVG